MTSKTKIHPDNPEQSKRFIESARQIGADETDEGADRAFKKVMKGAPVKSVAKK